MAIIQSNINSKSKSWAENTRHNRQLASDLDEHLEKVMLGGGTTASEPRFSDVG